MSKLTDRANYLKGLADGLKLNPEKDANKLLMEILPLLCDITEEIETLKDAVSELDDYVESIDDDLANMEESLFADEEELDDEEDDFEEDEIITYACPACGHEIEFEASEIDFENDYLCPACGESVFPILEDDEDEAADDAQPEGDDPDQE